MSFRAPSADVLGPHPGTSPHHAYFAGPTPPAGFSPPPPVDPWNHQALLAALNAANSTATTPQTAKWCLDTSASLHMSSKASNLSRPTLILNSLPITVGNGTTLSVTHRASSTIATTTAPLLLKNVLVSPSLVKNLISFRSLTRDNNVSVEFDPFGSNPYSDPPM